MRRLIIKVLEYGSVLIGLFILGSCGVVGLAGVAATLVRRSESLPWSLIQGIGIFLIGLLITSMFVGAVFLFTRTSKDVADIRKLIERPLVSPAPGGSTSTQANSEENPSTSSNNPAIYPRRKGLIRRHLLKIFGGLAILSLVFLVWHTIRIRAGHLKDTQVTSQPVSPHPEEQTSPPDTPNSHAQERGKTNSTTLPRAVTAHSFELAWITRAM